jgi:small conductance mechanosensitive channel
VGIIGLALGLAAQDSLGNLVAGLTILWDRPFRIGDNVTVAETFGRVQEIGLRSTRIRTVEQLDAILPNKEIINQKIINHTLNPMMRLGIPVGIAYREDTREARRVLLAAVKGHELLLDKPEPQVVVTALADSSVNLELRVWLRDPYTEREATFAMIEAAKIALDEAGIEIPFPQRTLHLPEGLRVVRDGGEVEPEETAHDAGEPEAGG